MIASPRTLIVGLGSPFGDDRLGWMVATRLALLRPSCQVIKLRSPVEVLDHLMGLEQLHLVDACRGAGRPGTIVRREWCTDDFNGLCFSGTHDLGLTAALKLASQLLMLPSRVTIWGVEMSDTVIDLSSISHERLAGELELAVEQLVARLAAETQGHAPVTPEADVPHA